MFICVTVIAVIQYARGCGDGAGKQSTLLTHGSKGNMMNNDYKNANGAVADFHETREDESQDWAALFNGLAC